MFKKAEFVLPEFEKVNRCAYFDYQREKVYARTKRKSRRTQPSSIAYHQTPFARH